MKYLISVLCVISYVLASPDPGQDQPFTYQFINDVDGSYSFNYAAEDSSRSETRKPDGTVIGGYQYIDSNGVLQKVQYQAGHEGVQVLGSNLPVGSTEPVKDTPEVARATEEHFHLVQKSLQLITRAKAFQEEYERKQALKKLHE